jgi:hypothetical protein
MIPEPPTLPAAPTFKSKALKENLLRKIIGWEIGFETSKPEDNIKKLK